MVDGGRRPDSNNDPAAVTAARAHRGPAPSTPRWVKVFVVIVVVVVVAFVIVHLTGGGMGNH